MYLLKLSYQNKSTFRLYCKAEKSMTVNKKYDMFNKRYGNGNLEFGRACIFGLEMYY